MTDPIECTAWVVALMAHWDASDEQERVSGLRLGGFSGDPYLYVYRRAAWIPAARLADYGDGVELVPDTGWSLR